MIQKVFKFCVAWFLLGIGRLASFLLLQVKVVGLEHAPTTGPLIVIANHFSWFDAPLLTLYLPFRPVFIVASESQRFWYVRLFLRVFRGIPIWRGRVDRTALQTALELLRRGDVIGIFPEGGIDPRLAERRARGEPITETQGHISRLDAQLTHPEPGTAYLALQSGARILPVALIGTEKILGNVMSGRRTKVIIHIGQVFDPTTVDLATVDREPQSNKPRRRLDRVADGIMQRIAVLFPPENRGPYRHINLEII